MPFYSPDFNESSYSNMKNEILCIFENQNELKTNKYITLHFQFNDKEYMIFININQV